MNDLNCKVSIITAVYNGASTIEQTIKSVLGQTYKNIEYIVIDGASTDGTQQIVEKYANDISYYISEKDKGLYYAMNKGIERATGEIIGIINCDDWYDKNAVKNIVTCFFQRDAELVYGKTVVVAEDGTKKTDKTNPLQTIWYTAPFRHPSVFVSKGVYDRYGVFDVNYEVAADYELLLRFYARKVKFEYVDKIIAFFRMGGISTIKRKIGYEENYKISMNYVDICDDKAGVMTKIKKTYHWGIFLEKVLCESCFIPKLIGRYFKKDIRGIFIFGTGIWGERCYYALSETGIKVIAFSDNDSAKWGTQFHGTDIINPNELKNLTAHVLIAVKEHGDEIKRQLNGMGNNGLKCVTINELKEIYCTE